MKTIFNVVTIVVVSFMLTTTAFAQKLERLVLSGPSAGVSNSLIHMAETGALNDIAKTVEFKTWKGPDQLRLMALGKGPFSADFMAMPSTVAANLYNRGVELKLMNISVWGILWMVSRDDDLTKLSDFKGKDIAMPFRADMPDIVFEQIVKAEGLDTRKDFNLKYMPTPMDAMQLLIKGGVRHALLTEPAISMALIRSPDLFRSVNIQEEWGRVFNREARIPQAGIVAMSSVLNKPNVLKRFKEEYDRSTAWILANPKEASKIIAKHLKKLSPQAIENSLEWTIFDVKSGKESQAELEFFFQKLLDSNPAIIGGKLPDDSFYH